jgi:3-oxoacyl-(acyl-carrier-protein) synthase
VDVSRIVVAGLGAVSPAGWNVAALRQALAKGKPLPIQSIERPGWQKPLRVRLVPNPAPRPEFLSHPRLRRTSPITHYAAAVALEAIACLRAGPELKRRVGLIVCLQAGCVQYTCRFFDETLKNPATASPLLFPETVYAAPGSHVAALLKDVTLVYSLVGDPASFLQGVALGAQWLEEKRADACLVIGTEEFNWILADALRYFDRSAILTSGAGALCLCREGEIAAGVELAAVTDAHTYSMRRNRAESARDMRRQLDGNATGELLCDGLGGSSRTDKAERAAWNDWSGSRLSPKQVLGEGLMAAAAWQCVAACDAVANGQSDAANVSLVGSNQQAIGARFMRTGSGISHLSADGDTGNIRS